MTKQSFILRPNDQSGYQAVLQFLASRNPEKTYKVTIQEYRSTRSLAQNSYYWAVVLPTIQQVIFETRGDHYSCDDIHEWMRDQFLPRRVITIKGEPKVVRPSTASLKVDEFSEYLEKIIHFCAENGIVIPDAE